MEKNVYEKNIQYLNNERLKLANSKELFWGKKLCKYLALAKNLKFGTVFKELSHDVYAFYNKKINYSIIDFETDYKRLTDKVTIYTSIYGDYDDILQPLTVDENCDYFIFTNKELPGDSIWKRADDSNIPSYCNTPTLKNRYVKMFPHKFFNSEYSIYIDGNIQPIGKVSRLIQNGLDQSPTGIAMHRHPRENCVYEEARTVQHKGKISKADMKKAISDLKKSGMPKHFGMFECNVIARKHSNLVCKEIMEDWMKYYLDGVKRDQLYFTYVLYSMGYKYEDVFNFGAPVNQNPIFFRKEHK